jgi:hypothetical protein
MANVFDALGRIDFLAVLWLFPIAFALHEAEEWNIVAWERRTFEGVEHATDRGARTWLVFITLIYFLWCGAATLPGNPALAAFVFLPAVAIAVQNALQHVYWSFHFRQYAPGVVTSVLLLIPTGGYVVARAVRQGHAPVWYAALWVVLILLGLVQTIRAGNQMASPVRAIHSLGNKLSEMIFGPV